MDYISHIRTDELAIVHTMYDYRPMCYRVGVLHFWKGCYASAEVHSNYSCKAQFILPCLINNIKSSKGYIRIVFTLFKNRYKIKLLLMVKD